MKIGKMNICVLATILTCCISLSGAQTLTPDLKEAPTGRGWKGTTADAKLVEKDGAAAIEFNKSGFVWLDSFEFTAGTIEFDAKGKSAPPQGSFVGVAFRVVDAKTYDAVYFRPFNFKSDDPARRAHGVQYVSEPDYPWQKLRTEHPGVYEKAVTPAPDPDGWFHARIVVTSPKVSVFVNEAKEPSLVVEKLNQRKRGSIGLWVGNGSGGDFANLKVIPAQ